MTAQEIFALVGAGLLLVMIIARHLPKHSH